MYMFEKKEDYVMLVIFVLLSFYIIFIEKEEIDFMKSFDIYIYTSKYIYHASPAVFPYY